MIKTKLQIRTVSFILPFVIGVLINSCIEPFDAKTENFETALVIEATITDEIKKQVVYLDRASKVENIGRNPEQNARVSIVDDAQNDYAFEEVSPGKYVSLIDFSILPKVTYQLHILTSDGRKYTSTPEKIPEETTITDFKAIASTNNKGQDGVSIIVTNAAYQDPKFFRYEYEETYKIIAPNWSGKKILSTYPVAVNNGIALENERICYATKRPRGLIIHQDEEGVTNSDLPEFQLRFVDKDDYILAHRYSILVRQYTISKEAYVYLETLKKFSGQESVLSETQPGFFDGNVYSESSASENVLGYFEVSSLSSKRIYFKFNDIYPDELPPTIGMSCTAYSAGLDTSPTLPELVRDNLVRFFSVVPDDPYSANVVPRICADCTVLGSSEVPDFWVE
tara:strand:- start:1884 stop:3071 length:1188 start_codon:yes stop_codon:yes gene_type:complete